MRRALYFDCFSGVSGDMTFGALLDLGLDQQAVFAQLAKLGINEYEIGAEKTEKYAITGTDLTVNICDGDDHVHNHGDQSHQHGGHRHDHDDQSHQHEGHRHDHDDQSHQHDDHMQYSGHPHHHQHGERNLNDIKGLIMQSGLSVRVKQLSVDIFTEIASAEARVHGKAIDEVHFHEVGAVDSIVDIVGVCICVDMLQIDDFYCSVLQEGQGFVQCRHGRLPVPVPAVMQMLGGSGLILKSGETRGELITPTGMGIVKVLAGRSGPIPAMRVLKTGYGFGKRDTGKLNGLRLIMGELYDEKADGFSGSEVKDAYDTDAVCEIKTNLDDATGEEIGFLTELLLEKGALDVFCTPVQMKKNRPGILLTVLAHSQKEKELAQAVLRHSAAIGVRITQARRVKLYREAFRVQTPYGEIAVKKSFSADGQIVRYAPEYEDCRQAARENEVPFKKVFELAKKAIDERQDMC